MSQNPPEPRPRLHAAVLALVQARGSLTFTQIVHATRANRGSVWHTLMALKAQGHLETITRHGRIHYRVTA